VVAAAFVARSLGRTGSPVRVRVRGGDILNVSFDHGARLEGPAETVFEGTVSI
jgi:diaminopimelate epimerase